MGAPTGQLSLAAKLLCLLTAVFAHAQQSAQILIGVLEDNPGQFAGEPYYRDVRVVFYRDGEQWKAMVRFLETTADCNVAANGSA